MICRFILVLSIGFSSAQASLAAPEPSTAIEPASEDAPLSTVAGVAVLAAIGVGAFLYMRSKASGADSPPLAEVQLVGSADESALPKAVASAPPIMPPPPPTGRNFCSNCGAPVQGRFCGQCGARA